jgi:hypothetical protein
MRTTVDIPDTLLKHLKARAALEGRTLRDLVVDLVEKGLNVRGAVDAKQRFLARPLVLPARGPMAVDLSRMSNADLYGLMNEDDDERAIELMARR